MPVFLTPLRLLIIGMVLFVVVVVLVMSGGEGEMPEAEVVEEAPIAEEVLEELDVEVEEDGDDAPTEDETP